MRLYDLLTTVICIIIVILFCCFSSLTRMDFKQVKAGVAYAASPADHIERQSRPFRLYFKICLGGLQKGRPISNNGEKITPH